MRASSEVRILIVEDTDEKREEIIRELQGSHSLSQITNIIIETADCFSSAQTKLEGGFFDVVILDLKIPIMPNGSPRLEHSRSLYQFIRDIAPSKPFFVLGLTSVPQEEIDSEFAETPNFSIERYEAGGGWLTTLVNRISFVVGAKAGLAHFLRNNYGLDVLIITARKKNEYDPIVEAIQWIGNYKAPRPSLGDIRNVFGHVSLGGARELSLGVVCLDEMGLSHSAAITSNLINICRPRHLAMLGMCCGLRKIVDPASPPQGAKCKLGDVIVARETCCWDEGKYEDDDPKLLQSPFFNNRAINKYPDQNFWRKMDRFLDEQETELSAEIEDFYNSKDLDEVRRKLVGDVKFSSSANVLWGSMVSGACVIDSVEMISKIEERFPRAIGLEMEAHSIYAAVDSCTGAKPNVLVIKGVADFGDGTKAKPIQGMASVGSYLVYKRALQYILNN